MVTVTRHLLTLTTTESHDYDPARVLRAYHALAPTITEGYYGTGDAQGYEPREIDTDESRICDLFDLLGGSMLGDWLFSSGNGPDSGKALESIEDDE